MSPTLTAPGSFDDPTRVLEEFARVTGGHPGADRLAGALAFARDVHAGQTRRDPRVPYWVHLVRVSGHLATWQEPCDTVLAGLLHDVIEDTPVGRELLAARFGEAVAETVEWVTSPREGLPDHYRRLQREGPRSARLVKLADRIDNLQSAAVELARTPTARERRWASGYLERSRHQTDPLTSDAPDAAVIAYRRAVADLRRVVEGGRAGR